MITKPHYHLLTITITIIDINHINDDSLNKAPKAAIRHQ
jgi:hypothetical protein